MQSHEFVAFVASGYRINPIDFICPTNVRYSIYYVVYWIFNIYCIHFRMFFIQYFIVYEARAKVLEIDVK